MSIKSIIVAFFILCSLTGFTQEKHLKKKEVLQKIILEIEKNYPENKSLHFYLIKEVDTSFTEAEFCFNSKEYNLKFLGDSLVETEIGIEFEDIPENIQSLIRKQLHSDFEKYKIKESQEVNPYTNPLYEIYIKTKNDHYYEYYFDQFGALIEKKEVVLKPISSQF